MIQEPKLSGKLRLADADLQWIRAKWKNIRESQQKADRASREWSRRNESLNNFLKETGITDIVQVTKIKGENLGLKDALSTHKWHAEEAQRHIDDVNLFLRLKELEVL